MKPVSSKSSPTPFDNLCMESTAQDAHHMLSCRVVSTNTPGIQDLLYSPVIIWHQGCLLHSDIHAHDTQQLQIVVLHVYQACSMLIVCTQCTLRHSPGCCTLLLPWSCCELPGTAGCLWLTSAALLTPGPCNAITDMNPVYIA